MSEDYDECLMCDYSHVECAKLKYALGKCCDECSHWHPDTGPKPISAEEAAELLNVWHGIGRL